MKFCANCGWPFFRVNEFGAEFCNTCRLPMDQAAIELCAAWEDEHGRTVYEDGTSIRDVEPAGFVDYEPDED